MKPTLLLIPGMLNTAAVWDGVAARLQSHADVRIADVQSQASIAEMAHDAWALLADVPAASPIVLCGFSMGGYVAIEMVAKPARPLAALVLADTSARPESPEGKVVREKTIAAIGRDFGKVADGIALFATHPSRHGDAAFMDGLRGLLHAVGGETAIRQNRAILGRADHRAALVTLTIPTLVLCGRDDRVTPPELAQELAALIPSARLEWIDDAGNMTPVEQPAQMAKLLAAFLDQTQQESAA